VIHLGQSVFDARGPDKGLRLFVVVVQVFPNGLLQLIGASEGSSAQAFLRQFTEPSLDQVVPGGTGGRRMKEKAAMLGQPNIHARMSAGTVIVQDQMQRQHGWRFSVQFAEITEKLLVPMPRHAFAQHDSLQDIQGHKQRRGPVTSLVMFQRAASTLLRPRLRNPPATQN